MSISPCLIPQPQRVLNFNDTQFCEFSQNQLILYTPSEELHLAAAAQSCFPNLSVLQEHSADGYFITYNDTANFHAPCGYDSYYLCISSNSFSLYAHSARGLFYGIQTLRKLITLYNGSLPLCELEDWASTERRCEYIEFRNFYPVFENAVLYLQRMAQNHINTLIVEFEDKRPFPTMPFLQNKSLGFTKQQIDELSQAAQSLYIELIPLQQSFGHLEYVLRFEQFRSLRELSNTPGDLCPLNPDSAALGRSLIRDMAALFPASTYLHLGCDEVWSLGTCNLCKESGLSKSQLFIQYINEMIDEAVSLGKTPLFWQDMLNGCNADELQALDKCAIVVVWMYNGNDLAFRAKNMVHAFQQSGVQVWGGCSVRCWDQSGNQNYPVLHKRLSNISQWNTVVQECALQGIVNTNWSAYSALASPYGIYETSFYPGAFAAALAWNSTEPIATFLQRYLPLFHGITNTEFLQEGWQFADYYEVLAKVADHTTREKEFAVLMQTTFQFEHFSKAEPSVALQMFRVKIYPDHCEEWESLHDRYENTLRGLLDIRSALESTLAPFLEPNKLQEYLCSRYFIWQTIEREVLHLAKDQNFILFEPILTK